MVPFSALLSASLIGLSAAITPEELIDWSFGMDGLGVTNRQDAKKLVMPHVKQVNAGRLSYGYLGALSRVMTDVMDMSSDALQQQFFSVAEAGVDPEVLSRFYKELHWSSIGCGMPEQQAREAAFELAGLHLDPTPIRSIWATLHDQDNADLDLPEAHRWVVDLMAAGADADTFLSEFKANYKNSNKDDALKLATFSAVRAGSRGLQARYAKDGKLYSAKDFQSHYGDRWWVEWLEAPLEKRVANDGKEYTIQQFQASYGEDFLWRWGPAPKALQRRMGKLGNTYTIQEFIDYFPGFWQTMFLKAPLVADDCAGLDQEVCEKRSNICQWRRTDDGWTIPCVVRSTMSAFLV